MSDNTEEIKLKTGEATSINLKGLATAGYQWNYTIDGNKDLVINIKRLCANGQR